MIELNCYQSVARDKNKRVQMQKINITDVNQQTENNYNIKLDKI